MPNVRAIAMGGKSGTGKIAHFYVYLGYESIELKDEYHVTFKYSSLSVSDIRRNRCWKITLIGLNLFSYIRY